MDDTFCELLAIYKGCRLIAGIIIMKFSELFLTLLVVLLKMKYNEYAYMYSMHVCSISIVVTTLECGPGGPWFKSEWMLIFYEARTSE